MPELPYHIIGKIIHATGSCREFCRNNLVNKEINEIMPQRFKFDETVDTDEFFDYTAKKYTLGQLKNPVGDEEIVFVKQYGAFFDIMLKKEKKRRGNAITFDDDLVESAINKKMWIYRWVLVSFARNTIDTYIDTIIKPHLSDCDSLHDTMEKLHQVLHFSRGCLLM